MKISFSTSTHIGFERECNEDSFAYCNNLNLKMWNTQLKNQYIPLDSYGAIAIVADGMGGANAGDIASSTAIKSIINEINISDIGSIIESQESITNYLSNIIYKANKSLLDYIEHAPETIGMGTTITILWIVNNKVYIAWCGDCRCYVFNKNRGLLRLTEDHSYVQELINKGELTIDDAFNHPNSNIITKCLGDCDVSSVPDILIHEINPNDQYILCSDGLCGYCKDTSIEEVLLKTNSNNAESLLELALSQKANDNITIISISIKDNDNEEINNSFLYRIKRLFCKKNLHHSNCKTKHFIL